MKKTVTQFLSLLLAFALFIYTIGFSLPLLFFPADTNIEQGTEEIIEDEIIDTPDGEEMPEQGASPPADEPPTEIPADPPSDSTEIEEATYIRAIEADLPLYSGPGTSYRAVGSLDSGDMVSLIDTSGQWYTTYYQNTVAYVSAAKTKTELFTIPINENETVEEVISCGLPLLGLPYVYGATRLHDGYGNLLKGFTPKKFDCSSLTQYIFYYGAQINLLMTTRTQIRQGVHVERTAIQRGDLLFFTNADRYYETGLERVGHVALYLGENYILHTASDHAVIEQISTQRWSYFIEARRYI